MGSAKCSHMRFCERDEPEKPILWLPIAVLRYGIGGSGPATLRNRQRAGRKRR